MLGIDSISIEVNPYLADLVQAKTTQVSSAAFCAEYEDLMSALEITRTDSLMPDGMPATFTEPGVKDRYVFSADVYQTARAIVRSTSKMSSDHARLLKVLLGSTLVSNSNVTINGKGRRYRKGWESKQKSAQDLIGSLDSAVDVATEDLTKFAGLSRGNHTILRGDCRQALAKVHSADVVIFSPPYPNSFDYTDVYNLELWMLGYLGSGPDNRSLRNSTLRSHVQTKWRASSRLAVSKSLDEVVTQLVEARRDLWNPNIPEMVGYYFDDLCGIFTHFARILPQGHYAVAALGDSQYAHVHIDVATILAECVHPLGFRLIKQGAIRSMRTSSQHGGSFNLSEHCLVFERT